MEDGDNDSLSAGNAHRRLLFLSQLSQGVDGSQRGNPLVSETSIDKSLDVRLLSQMDFFTPAFTQENSSQFAESVRDSNENSFIYGETPQKKAHQGARSLFKRKAGIDLSQPEAKRDNLFSCTQEESDMTVATLPVPETNPFLHLPEDVESRLKKLEEKRDLSILDESRISRYQRDFKELEILGKGASSTVTLCKHRIDGCYYAVKQIPLSGTPAKRSATLRKAMREVQLASVLSEAPHTVRYFGCWREEDCFFIQLESSFHGSVSKFVERSRLTEEDVGELLWQVAGALQWLHGRGFAHLDVKPDNILIMRRRGTGERKSAWSFKLSDFGLTCQVDTQTLTEGDARYLPPELLTRETAMKADVFALGVTVIHLLSPRAATERKEFFASVRSGKIPNECRISPHLRMLVREMINGSVEDRLTMEQVVHHAYFESGRNRK
ncbi:hypothetical protein WA538_004614 [Blastocystis sp. DL]